MYELRTGYGSVCKDDQVSARALELAGCKPAPEGPTVVCPAGGAPTAETKKPTDAKTKSDGKDD
jgi:hypothetical protein